MAFKDPGELSLVNESKILKYNLIQKTFTKKYITYSQFF